MFENIPAKGDLWKIWGMMVLAFLFVCYQPQVRADKIGSEKAVAIIGKLNDVDPGGQAAFDELRILLIAQGDAKSVADVARYILNDDAVRRLDLLWLLKDVSAKHPKSFGAASEHLIKAFPNLDSTEKHAICRILSSVPDDRKKAVMLFREVIRTYDSESQTYVRSFSAGALLKVAPEDDEALGFLVRLTASANADAQIRAAYAAQWAGVGAKPMLPILRAQLNSRHPSVRVVSATAVLAVGADAKNIIPTLRESLQHHSENFYVEPMYYGTRHLAPTPARWAVNALGNLGAAAEAAVPDLIQQLKIDDDLHFRTTTQALGKIGTGAKSAVPILEKMCVVEKAPQRKQAIAEALRKIKLTKERPNST